MKVRHVLLCAGIAGGALAPAASAHVTAQPGTAVAGDFARVDFRVPNERARAATTAVTVRIPPGMFFVSFRSTPGWRRTVRRVPVSPPVTLFGVRITERVASVTWSGGRIRPEEFEEFSISARIPSTPGRTLLFPALQRYAGGEVVRWDQPGADAERPAPRVRVLRAR